MDRAAFERLDRWFQAAMSTSEPQRESLVLRCRTEDPELTDLLVELLEKHDDPSGLLGESPRAAGSSLREDVARAVGERSRWSGGSEVSPIDRDPEQPMDPHPRDTDRVEPRLSATTPDSRPMPRPTRDE